MSHTFKLSAISLAALLAACGGGGSDPVTSPATTPPVASVAPSVEPALDAAKAFLARFDASLATAIPTPGAAALALSDGCFLADGRSKAYSVADFDADPQAVASRQDVVGSKRSNVTVLADRTAANADGTSRREIDIKFDITYKDGSKFESAADTVPDQTIISGSSAGARLADGTVCTTPDSKSDWRFYGNRKLVRTAVFAINERQERTALATGLPASPQVFYSKYLSLAVSDPANVSTYAIVTGPGLGLGTSAGTPGSLKLLSARIFRAAPELAGKRRNVIDFRDIENFSFCSNATGDNAAPAVTADCVANGGVFGSGYGQVSSSSAATVDTAFANLNIKAGDAYTIAVYNDDGWKTVNGQLGKTPIATYTNVLRALPFSAATLAGTGVTADLFPRVATSTKTPAEIATAIKAKAAISTDATWTLPGTMPDGRLLQMPDSYVFI